MGLFDFVKDAGSAIFGDVGKEDIGLQTFHGYLTENALDSSGLNFDHQGDKLTVSGSMPTQETKEKAIMLLGNVKGISQVEDLIMVGKADAPAAPAAASNERTAANPAAEATPTDWAADTYTVKSGDSLSKIAKEIYGDPMKYTVIFEANTPMLKDPDKIQPGQVLRIPAL